MNVWANNGNDSDGVAAWGDATLGIQKCGRSEFSDMVLGGIKEADLWDGGSASGCSEEMDIHDTCK